MACKFSKADLQFTARLLDLKFLGHLLLGSPDCAEGRGFLSVMEA